MAKAALSRETNGEVALNTTRISRAVGLLVLAWMAAACTGGQPGGEAIDPEFLKKANDVCTEAFSRRPEAPPPLPMKNFDPRNPEPDQLPAIADHFAKFNDPDLVVSELVTLGEPSKGEEHWRASLAIARRSAANGNAQIEAARAKDTAAFVRFVNEGDDIRKEFGKVVPTAGFDASSACGRDYG